MLATHPAVFAVGRSYQIMVSVTAPSFFWVRVGGKEYYDEANGIMRSMSPLHRVTVPAEALDAAGEYTVCVHPIEELLPYFTKTKPVVEISYKFYPVPSENIRAYHISDAHNHIDGPVRAASVFGDIDLLILNGDILDHSGDPSKFDNIYEISSRILKGERPTVFSRGNHDLRGAYAEKFAEYTPNEGGNTYYSLRLGGIWALLVDCGEDKDDYRDEYGGTIRCHVFRERQTEYIKKVIANAAEEYEAPGVTHKVVISHVPFFYKHRPPFNIEPDIYTEWSRLLRESVKPEIMICGHLHLLDCWMPGGEKDSYGQPCPCVIGGDVRYDDGYFAGCGYLFGKDSIEYTFTDSDGKVLGAGKISL